MKHGEAALAPSRRPGNLLLAHKSSHVSMHGLSLPDLTTGYNRFTTSLSDSLLPLYPGTTRSTTSSPLSLQLCSPGMLLSSNAQNKWPGRRGETFGTYGQSLQPHQWFVRWFVGGIKACMRACDLDDRAVELVICLPDVAEIVTRNPLIRHITCKLLLSFGFCPTKAHLLQSLEASLSVGR